MKPQLLKVPLNDDFSFSVRRDIVPYFYNQWHYHPEIELIHLEEGSGTQFVGDDIRHFQAGDLLLIGSDLPHYWRCDEKYFTADSEDLVKATVVHFRDDFWGKAFLQLPENRKVRELLEESGQGVRFFGTAQEPVKRILGQALHAAGSHRIRLLLEALEILAGTQERQLLSTVGHPKGFNEEETDRINRIYKHSLEHFQRKISLGEIAGVAHISPHSFCRYFKTRTRKTYFRFLLELRVGHACKLLTQGKLSIAQTCYESGFNNFANFNRYFKGITGKTPSAYRKSHRP